MNAVDIRSAVGWHAECLLKLQNKSKEESFTDAKVVCCDGYFWVHGIIFLGSLGVQTKDVEVDCRLSTVKQVAPYIFLLYLGISRMDASAEITEMKTLQTEKIMKWFGSSYRVLMSDTQKNEWSTDNETGNIQQVIRYTMYGSKCENSVDLFISVNGNVNSNP